jgi:hypothetical protein
LSTDLSDFQFGFRWGRSTQDALRCVLDLVKRATEGSCCDRDLCVVIAVEISNAFNSASWGHIDAALSRLHLPNYLVNFLMSYLSEGTIKVKEDNSMCGVPQGPIL